MNPFRFIAALTVFCLAFVLSAGATDYYVSPSGNDAFGDGSQGRPWRTIQRAAEDMWAGDTCHVANGTYEEMVLPPRSGAPGQHISFVADGSSVYVRGTRQITGWTVHSGNIWKANVSWNFDELFVDRQRMVLARWPNLTGGDVYRPNFYQATANGGKTSIIDSVHLTQPGGYWSGAKIFMVPGLGWTAEQIDVSGYDPAEHRITFSNATSLNYYDADQYSLYFLYNKLSLLDAPSEWFLDRASGTVYLWLPDGGNPNNHLVESSGGSGGFDLTDRSYIRVAGFKLMSGDIKLLNATACRVEEVRHLFPAAELYVSGSDNLITRSEIAYASYTGVRLAGTRNTLSTCHVHHCNYFGTGDSLVEFGSNNPLYVGASQNTIVDCSLHDTGRDGISIVGIPFISACIIEHNEIYNVGLVAKDLGGFYTWGMDGGGTVIRYNIFHDVWTKNSPQYSESIRLGYGIYLDESSSGFSVHHNVVYRTSCYAIMLHQASRNNLVYNNTTVGSGTSGAGWGDVINSSPGGNSFGVDGTVVANNLAVMFDDRSGWCINFVSEVPLYHHNGYYNQLHSTHLHNQGLEGTAVTGNPLFTCADGNDFSLLVGSPMIDRGAVIPGITDGYIGAAPDLGAYERGGAEQPGPRDKWWVTSRILTMQTSTGGTTNPTPGAYSYDQGATVCVSAVAEALYDFDSWSGDASGTAASITVAMASDKTVKANFTLKPALTIQSGSGGTTDPAPGSYRYAKGSSVTIRAVSNTGYRLGSWSGDASGNAASITMAMTSDKTVRANFQKIIYAAVNAAGQKVLNRSLGKAEYINILTWAANSANSSLNIVSYKIYRIDGTTRTEIGTVAATAELKLVERNVAKDTAYTYEIVAVSNEPREGDAASVTVR